MITLDKIKIFESNHGLIDSFIRIASTKEKQLMNDEDWRLIESFIQDIKLVQNHLVSKSYENNLQYYLKENCDTSETINELLKVATKIK